MGRTEYVGRIVLVMRPQMLIRHVHAACQLLFSLYKPNLKHFTLCCRLDENNLLERFPRHSIPFLCK